MPMNIDTAKPILLNAQSYCALGIVALVIVVDAYFVAQRQHRFEDPVIATVGSYLKAINARNFNDAYRYLSTADRQVRGEAGYVESQGAYSGFALESASKLASFMQVWPIEQSGRDELRRIKVGYRVPAPADLAGLLLNWDETRLNALPRDRQQQILAEIDVRRKDSKLLMIEGQEQFELSKDGKAWKIFLDWASGTTVKLKTQLPKSGELEVRLAQTEVIAKNDELFLVNLVQEPRFSHCNIYRRSLDKPPCDRKRSGIG